MTRLIADYKCATPTELVGILRHRANIRLLRLHSGICCRVSMRWGFDGNRVITGELRRSSTFVAPSSRFRQNPVRGSTFIAAHVPLKNCFASAGRRLLFATRSTSLAPLTQNKRIWEARCPIKVAPLTGEWRLNKTQNFLAETLTTRRMGHSFKEYLSR